MYLPKQFAEPRTEELHRIIRENSLGSFASEAAANEALGELALRGIRTARVLQERAEMPGQRLRLPALDDGQRGKLEALRPALAGQLLQACG